MREWDKSYPDQGRLRAEVLAMRQSVLEALLSALGEDAFVGVYAKGSALKPWDSPLDYVPELSDLDVQLLLSDPNSLIDLGLALKIQADFERRFFARTPDPLHLPRPQIQVINRYLESKTFSPSHPNTVHTLFGRPYAEVHPFESQAAIWEADAFGLKERTKPEELAELPLGLIDKPGKYMFHVLRQLTWRVGPTGSRVLSVLGADFETAWGGNRTHVHAKLIDAGQGELARCYAEFYLRAWEFFGSAYQNANPAREAVLAGVRVLELGLEIGSGL